MPDDRDDVDEVPPESPAKGVVDDEAEGDLPEPSEPA